MVRGRYLTAVGLLTGLMFAMPLLSACAEESAAAARLAKIEHRLAEKYDSLQHANADEVDTLLAGPNTVLLDVREASEFEVSHLAGATRIDPDATGEEALALLGELPAGTDIVLYCSVGQRSSRLGKRLQDALADRSDIDIVNLRGGIFAWHNDERPLRDGDSATELVHSYSIWRRNLIERTDLIASKPN